MRIYGADISGSLSVSGSAEIQEDVLVSGSLTVLGGINATISGTITNADTAENAPKYTLTSSFNTFTSSYNTGSFTGSFSGDGSNLYNIPASGVTGLNLSQISDGSATASISNTDGFKVNTDTEVTGTLRVTGSIVLNGVLVGTGKLNDTEFYNYTSSINPKIGSIESTTSSLNSFTSSINDTIKNKLNTDGVISGSIQIDITQTTGYSTFSTSIATTTLNVENRIGSLETESGSVRSAFNNYTSSNNTRISTIESTTSSLNTFTSSTNSKLSSIESSTSSLNSFTSSINTTIKNKLNTDGVISGSIQVDITQTTGYSTFSSSISSSVGALSSSVAATTNGLSSSIATYNSGQDTRLTSLEGKTGSYATTGSNIFIGNQTITGSVIITENLRVFGSSSITYVTASQLAVSTSFISVNVFEPAERFGGIKVYDSGSSAATASLAWDSLNNRWIYQNASGSSYSGGMLIAGPRNTGSLGEEPSLTSGKIVKSVGGDHIDNSIMSESGNVIYITGSLSATGTVYGTNITAIESTTSSLNSYTSSNDSTNTIQNNRLTSIETSTGSLNSFTNSINTTIKNRLNAENVLSSSAQVVSALPAGTVSGSSQVLNGTTIHSGSFFNGITVVSGSAQISFSGISGVPSGLVSGSSQISYTGLSNIPSGIVSGSSQITYSGISGIPSGIVSGSSQIAIASTSGFGTYLNQAVLTTSSPTFSAVTATTFTGNLSGNASTATSVSATYAAPNEGNLVYAAIADNDFFRIRVGGSSNAGWVEIATADDGTEPIYVRQYTGVFSSLTRTATLLDGSGNTSFPGSVTASSFSGTIAGSNVSGNISGNASNITSYTINQSVGTSNTPTFAGVKGSSYFDAQANSGFRIRNAADSANVGGFTRRGLWEGNSNYDPSIWTETGYGLYFYTNGSATIKTMISPNGSFLHGHSTTPSESAWLGTGVFGRDGYNKVILGSLNSTTTGAYIGGHNSALSAWADINVAGDSVIFRYQQTETMRINTSGHLIPANNGTQNLGSSTQRWNTVFTSDLSMSNGIGDYTIVEGEEDLFIYNNKTNKVFKFLLQEVDPLIAPPKKI